MTAAIVWGEGLLRYDLGDHPLDPVRLELTMALAHGLGVPVVALAGSLGEGYEALYNIGITAAFSLAGGPISLAEAVKQAPALLAQRACDATRLWLAAGKRRL